MDRMRMVTLPRTALSRASLHAVKSADNEGEEIAPRVRRRYAAA